jgi:hypothetical protein
MQAACRAPRALNWEEVSRLLRIPLPGGNIRQFNCGLGSYRRKVVRDERSGERFWTSYSN